MRLMISASPSLSSSSVLITKVNNRLSSSQLTCLLRSIFSSSPIPLCCNYSSSSPPEEEEVLEAQTSLLNSSSAAAAETQTSPPCSILMFDPPNNPRTRTPLEKQFETWVDKLKPGFTPLDVDDALRSQSDPDLALDIFRWTAQRRGYKHNHITYHTIIQISISGKRFGHTETLIDEVVAGACSGSLPLYNSIIRYCCIRRPLFNRAFDVYKKMLKSPPPSHSRPSLETYTMLLNALLRKFNKLNICYVYLHAVRSLLKQMKASGVIPDTYALNLIIKAYSKCLEMNGAIRVFREMGLYGCQPNSFSYSYIVKGLCEKGRVTQGFDFYKEMRDKALIPTSSTYMILICSLSLESRFEEAIEIMFDMLGNSMVPDVLTYRTLLEGLCREGKGDKAFELLEEVRKKQGSMGDKTYKNLLDELHFLSQE